MAALISTERAAFPEHTFPRSFSNKRIQRKAVKTFLDDVMAWLGLLSLVLLIAFATVPDDEKLGPELESYWKNSRNEQLHWVMKAIGWNHIEGKGFAWFINNYIDVKNLYLMKVAMVSYCNSSVWPNSVNTMWFQQSISPAEEGHVQQLQQEISECKTGPVALGLFHRWFVLLPLYASAGIPSE